MYCVENNTIVCTISGNVFLVSLDLSRAFLSHRLFLLPSCCHFFCSVLFVEKLLCLYFFFSSFYDVLLFVVEISFPSLFALFCLFSNTFRTDRRRSARSWKRAAKSPPQGKTVSPRLRWPWRATCRSRRPALSTCRRSLLERKILRCKNVEAFAFVFPSGVTTTTTTTGPLRCVGTWAFFVRRLLFNILHGRWGGGDDCPVGADMASREVSRK